MQTFSQQRPAQRPPPDSFKTPFYVEDLQFLLTSF